MSKKNYDLKKFTNGDILWIFQEMRSCKGARLVYVNVKTHDMIFFWEGFASNLERGKSIVVIFCKAIVSKPIWGQVY
jgi:hypothetical protein